MTPRKPDRFERSVMKLKITSPSGNYYKESVLRGEVLKILRCEHTAVMRIVKRIQDEYKELNADDSGQYMYFGGAIEAIEKILASLAKRKG